MSDLPGIIGAGGVIEVEIDGVQRQFRWTPLTLGDLGQLEADIRAELGPDRLDQITPAMRIIEQAKLQGDDRSAAIHTAMEEHLRIRRLSAFQLADEFCLPETNARLLMALLKKHHPDITKDQVMQMVGSQVFSRISWMIMEQARAALTGKANSHSSGVSLARTTTAAPNHPTNGESSSDTSSPSEGSAIPSA